ncbi:DUF3667 domain-containing protein [Flavobacterium cyanobacteriorum]|nr:DUF3667 domain-containing protein [Flavobacterium cyanobacteriorum]
MATTTCKNCTTNFEGNYCVNCGQSAHTHAIDWHYVWHEIQHGIFHVDKGLLFTIKELTLRPGSTIRQFIAGRRVAYFKPTAMVIFLATLYGFLYHYFEVDLMFRLYDEHSKEAHLSAKVQEWITSHYTLVTLMIVPLYGMVSYLMFRKSRYNFIEHMVLNTFLAGQKLVLHISLLPLLYACKDSIYANWVPAFLFITDIALTLWIYISFFDMFSVLSRVIRTFLSYIFVMLFVTIVGTIIALILLFMGFIVN